MPYQALPLIFLKKEKIKFVLISVFPSHGYERVLTGELKVTKSSNVARYCHDS